MAEWKFNLPLSIKVGRKQYALNLNIYRNTHYQILNRMKKEFSSSIATELFSLPKFKKLRLIYTLYPRTNRLCDVANVCSIADKFFCDALVQAGRIEDDNYKIVDQLIYRFGGIDKTNPRIEVNINGETYEDQSRSE